MTSRNYLLPYSVPCHLHDGRIPKDGALVTATAGVSSDHSLQHQANIEASKESMELKEWDPESKLLAAPAMSCMLRSPPYEEGEGAQPLRRELTMSRKGSSTASSSNLPVQEVSSFQGQDKEEDHSVAKSLDKSSRAEDLMQKRKQQAARKFSSTGSGKGSKDALHKLGPCSATSPAAAVAEGDRSLDVSVSETITDDEESDADREEHGPLISEKRRKRMLSNRASAQRSRQRRQDRLDTLEVLVAELRVENAALNRTANNSRVTVKELEEENRSLRDRLQEKTELVQNAKKAFIAAEDAEMGDGDGKESVSNLWTQPKSSLEAKDDERTGKGRFEQGGDSERDEVMENSQQQQWSSTFCSGFSPCSWETAAPERSLSKTPSQEKTREALDFNLPQAPPFQSELDQFAIDLEPNQEMDNKILDSKIGEDFWLYGLSGCLK